MYLLRPHALFVDTLGVTLLEQMCMRFRPQVNIPGAVIIESGSVGRKLYSIKSGHCVVVP